MIEDNNYKLTRRKFLEEFFNLIVGFTGVVLYGKLGKLNGLATLLKIKEGTSITQEKKQILSSIELPPYIGDVTGIYYLGNGRYLLTSQAKGGEGLNDLYAVIPDSDGWNFMLVSSGVKAFNREEGWEAVLKQNDEGNVYLLVRYDPDGQGRFWYGVLPNVLKEGEKYDDMVSYVDSGGKFHILARVSNKQGDGDIDNNPYEYYHWIITSQPSKGENKDKPDNKSLEAVGIRYSFKESPIFSPFLKFEDVVGYYGGMLLTFLGPKPGEEKRSRGGVCYIPEDQLIGSHPVVQIVVESYNPEDKFFLGKGKKGGMELVGQHCKDGLRVSRVVFIDGKGVELEGYGTVGGIEMNQEIEQLGSASLSWVLLRNPGNTGYTLIFGGKAVELPDARTARVVNVRQVSQGGAVLVLFDVAVVVEEGARSIQLIQSVFELDTQYLPKI